MARKVPTMIKTIYFDQNSVTDLIHVLGNGKSSEKKEHIITKPIEVDIGAEASEKLNVLGMITAKVGGPVVWIFQEKD